MRLPWRKSASEMFVNLSIISFSDMFRILTYEIMSRVCVSNNLLISNIYNSLILCIQMFGLGGIVY